MLTLLVLIFIATSHVYLVDAVISPEEFNAAVTKNNFPIPSEEVYNIFIQSTRDFSLEEQAMFIAQLLHESGGFRYTEELACLQGDRCDGKYIDKVGLPGKKYYGRGYIQLTWGENYKAASQALGLGDKLLQHPELVASDKRLSMQVSVWYWDSRVRPALKKNPNQFGVTTMAINGGECKYSSLHPRAQNRWKIYLKVAEALKVVKKADENGCYN